MGIISLLKRFFYNLFTYKPKTRVKKDLYIPQKVYRCLKFVYKKNYGLSYETEFKAVRKHNNLIKEFYNNYQRYPTQSEVGRIIINASHITIKYRRGQSGHWGRQKVRHYLFNLHGLSYIKK